MPSFLCSAPHKQTHALTDTKGKERGGAGVGVTGKKKQTALGPPQGLKELGSILSEQNGDSKEIAV